MTAIEHIKAAQKITLVDESRKQVTLELAPALGSDRIEAMQRRVGQPLPKELQEILAFCSGIDGCPGEIDFTGETKAFEAAEIFPDGLPIASDGCGNFWVLDITPQTTLTAPVFFACHDAPVILYQSPDIASFIAETFRMMIPPYESLVNDVAGDKLFNVWRTNPGVMEQATAVTSPDIGLRSFASGLPEHFQIIDLRNVSPGMGFSWGRYGPQTEVRRFGYERIFGYAKPPRTGLFSRFFRK